MFLGGNAIRDAGAVLLADGLKKNGCLRELNLSYNQIGSIGSTALAEMVGANHALNVLDLSHNHIGGEGLHAWFGAALKSNSCLSVLKLSHNNIGDEGASEVFSSLVHEKSKTPRKAGWAQETENPVIEPVRLHSNSTLHTLLMSDIAASLTTASHIASVLRTNHNIKTLDVSSNQFEDAGVKILAQGLLNNIGLQVLNFAYNRMSPETSQMLCESIAAHQQLRKVNLYGCLSGSESASHVAMLLKKNSTLRELDLCDCPFEAPGIVLLCNAVGVNSGLEVLEMTSSGLQADSTIQTLANSLVANQSLRSLNLGYNNITLRGCKWLMDAIVCGHGKCQLSEDTLILQGNSGFKDRKGDIILGGVLSGHTSTSSHES